jgi:PAS domain S-box-containing protein
MKKKPEPEPGGKDGSLSLHLKDILGLAPDSYLITDTSGLFIDGGVVTEAASGFTVDDLRGQNIFQIDLVPSEDREAARDFVKSCGRGRHAGPLRLQVKRKDGRLATIEVMGFPIRFRGESLVLLTVHAMEKLERIESMLRESGELFESLVRQSSNAAYIFDHATKRIVDCNEAFLVLMGYEAQEIADLTVYDIVAHERADVDDYVARILEKGATVIGERQWKARSGNVIDVLISAFRVKHGKKTLIFVTARDIGDLKTMRGELQRAKNALETEVKSYVSELSVTAERLSREIDERKRVEETLKLSEEKFRMVVEHATEAIIIAQDGKFKFVNRKALELVGDTTMDVIDLDIGMFIHPDDQNSVLQRHEKRLSGETVPNEYNFRLKDVHGNSRWVSIKAVLTEWNGRPATLNFIMDITEQKKAEEDIRQSYEKLQRTMEGIIKVMTTTVEIRDPYTAGHQRRVSQLALAMGRLMELPPGSLDAIHMAGLIHDMGKISIPAEILSKPGKLSSFEFEIIKSHPSIGYDILKSIEFPWPLAEIVLQHHERLNGSGYPRKMKKDDILMEARILGVADVVEAMASHRPYRPALGIEAALDEISRNSGTLYDDDAVKACLSLFHEKKFKLD